MNLLVGTESGLLLLDRSGQGKVYPLISRRRFQQMDVLEGLNVLVTISGMRQSNNFILIYIYITNKYLGLCVLHWLDLFLQKEKRTSCEFTICPGWGTRSYTMTQRWRRSRAGLRWESWRAVCTTKSVCVVADKSIVAYQSWPCSIVINVNMKFIYQSVNSKCLFQLNMKESSSWCLPWKTQWRCTHGHRSRIISSWPLRWVRIETSRFGNSPTLKIKHKCPVPALMYCLFLQSFGDLVHKPLLVDLTVEEGQRLKVIYGSCTGFHAVDVDSGAVYDIYLPTHVSTMCTSAAF